MKSLMISGNIPTKGESAGLNYLPNDAWLISDRLKILLSLGSECVF